MHWAIYESLSNTLNRLIDVMEKLNQSIDLLNSRILNDEVNKEEE